MWWNSSLGQLTSGPGQTSSVNTEDGYCYDLSPSILAIPERHSNTLKCSLCQPGFFWKCSQNGCNLRQTFSEFELYKEKFKIIKKKSFQKNREKTSQTLNTFASFFSHLNKSVKFHQLAAVEGNTPKVCQDFCS